MKRILRKVTSICIATFMVAAMSVTALATELPSGGVVGDNDPADALETTLVIQKDLKVYNPSATEVYGPGVTYSYEIEAGSANKTITDADGVKALTKAGIGTPSITATVSYANDELVNAGVTGASNNKPIEIGFDGIAFPGAGVYRYKITETCSDKAAHAVVGDETTTIRYLDVYVRDPKTGETGYQIYGYVMFENDSDINGSDTGNNLTDVVKTESFSTDSYYTYNLEVSKTLVNDAANEDHDFPFTLTVTKPSGVTGEFKLIASDSTDAVAMADSIGKGLSNGDSVKYTGIPCGTTIAITENNDVDAKIYYVTTTGAETNLTNFLLNPGADTDAVSVSTTAGQAGEDKTVEFTNTYVLISPTGVAMAVLPFVILLGFGIGFMVISTTKRKEEQA